MTWQDSIVTWEAFQMILLCLQWFRWPSRWPGKSSQCLEAQIGDMGGNGIDSISTLSSKYNVSFGLGRFQ